jgi:hypothetical protein
MKGMQFDCNVLILWNNILMIVLIMVWGLKKVLLDIYKRVNFMGYIWLGIWCHPFIKDKMLGDD